MVHNFQCASLGILITSIPKYFINADIIERELFFKFLFRLLISSVYRQNNVIIHFYQFGQLDCSFKLLVIIQHYIIMLLSLFLLWLLRATSIGSFFLSIISLCGFFALSFFTFSYFKIILAHIFTVSILVSIISLTSFCSLFFTLFLAMLGLPAHRVSLVAVSRSYSLVAVPGLLIAIASLVAELGLCRVQASIVVVRRLSCPRHVEPSRTRDEARVPCIGRQILYH